MWSELFAIVVQSLILSADKSTLKRHESFHILLSFEPFSCFSIRIKFRLAMAEIVL